MKNRAFALIITVMLGSGAVGTIINYSGEEVILQDGTTFDVNYLPEHMTKTYGSRELFTDSLIIYIHHTAVTSEAKIESIANYHVEHNDWARIAYHSGIAMNGDLLILNSIETISYHTAGHNTEGISIVLLGDYTTEEVTDVQLETLKKLTDAMCMVLPIKAIMGHRDASGAATSCPGDNAYNLLKNELFY